MEIKADRIEELEGDGGSGGVEIDPSRIEVIADQPAAQPNRVLTAAKQVGSRLTPSGMADTVAQNPTAQNIGQGLPAAELAANMVSSSYGVPISGLVGLAALLGTDLEGADKARQFTENLLVYKPQTSGGKQLATAMSYPVEKLDSAARAITAKVAPNNPDLAAAIHSGIVGAPAVITGGRTALKGVRGPGVVLDSKLEQTINRGINKAIAPSVPRSSGQFKLYFKLANRAVKKIIGNREYLQILDKDGIAVDRLPHTVDEFRQAITQTKRIIFEEYDDLAKATTKKGIDIPIEPLIRELESIGGSEELAIVSPETIAYTRKLVNRYHNFVINKNKIGIDAKTVQNAIAMLNESEKAYKNSPSIQTKGRAYVDAMIANHFRKELDRAVMKATGKQYQPLKDDYGALSHIEKAVVGRAIKVAQKQGTALIDFSSVFSGYSVIRGLIGRNMAAITAGLGARAIAGYAKWLHKPDRLVKNMFLDADYLIKKRQGLIEGSPVISTGLEAQLGQGREKRR